MTILFLIGGHQKAAEFEFRYNHRVGNGCDDEMRAERALAGIKGKRLMYRDSSAAVARTRVFGGPNL